MNFQRLNRGDVMAMVAALALLLIMALDWYGTELGAEARRIEELQEPDTPGAAERREDAANLAEGQERNAFQPDGFVDVLLMLALLATVLAGVAAAFLRAANRRFNPPFTPSGICVAAALVALVLTVFNSLEELGLSVGETVEAGAPLGLIALGAILFGASTALQAEERGTAWPEPGPAGAGEDGVPSEEKAGEGKRRRFRRRGHEEEAVAAAGEAAAEEAGETQEG